MSSPHGASNEGLDRRLLAIASVVVLGAIMSILDTTVVNVAINTLSRDFETDLATIQWIVTGYTLALATVIPVTGWAADRFGTKRLYLLAIALFVGGSALCGAAWSAWGPRAVRTSWAGAAVVAIVCAVASAATGMLDVNLRVPADRVGVQEKPYNQMVDKGPGAEKEEFDGAFVRRHTLRWIDHLPPEVSFMGLTQADLDRPEVEVASGEAVISGLLVRSWKVAFHAEATGTARLRVNNYRFPGVPLFIQKAERDAARTTLDYSLPDKTVDFEGATLELLDGDAEIATGVRIILTPGHTEGHQSFVVDTQDGRIILAGQAFNEASDYARALLAWRLDTEGQPHPPYAPWVARFQELDPWRVLFAHDLSIWERGV